jgi:GNAT superfamily N-acetyltransferase
VNLSIRPYAPSDLEVCRDLWRELTQRHRDIYEDPSIGGDEPAVAFDAYLEDPHLAGLWVVEKDGAVVAFCGLLVEGEEGEVEPIVVRSAERSKGTGGQLLEHAIEEARRRGVRYLSVRPVARNVEAISFFYRTGFQALGQIDLTMNLTGSTPPVWKPGITIHGRDFKY